MKAFARTLRLAAVAVAIVGCGGGKESAPTFRAPTTTITGVKTGTPVRCENGEVAARAKAPAPGRGTAIFADGTRASASLRLTRRQDGSLLVVCTG